MTKGKTWLCRCGSRIEYPKRKCPSCGSLKAKKRVPVHARTLRDDDYPVYLEANEVIHGVSEVCAVCGRGRGERRFDRDHGHNKTENSYGRPRGLVCVQDNMLMPRGLTAAKAREIAAYLSRVESFYGQEEIAA